MIPLFKSPSRIWGWMLYVIAATLLAVNFMFLIRNIREGEWGSTERLSFAVVFSFMVASWHLLFGYHYLRWATSRKAELLRIAEQKRNILFEKYNRVFINEESCYRQGIDPLRFKRLRQADLREVIQKLANKNT